MFTDKGKEMSYFTLKMQLSYTIMNKASKHCDILATVAAGPIGQLLGSEKIT